MVTPYYFLKCPSCVAATELAIILSKYLRRVAKVCDCIKQWYYDEKKIVTISTNWPLVPLGRVGIGRAQLTRSDDTQGW